MCKKLALTRLKIVTYKLFKNPIYLIYVYKQNLGLNNLDWSIYKKEKKNTHILIQNEMY